jgi:hypothetical protein
MKRFQLLSRDKRSFVAQAGLKSTEVAVFSEGASLPALLILTLLANLF